MCSCAKMILFFVSTASSSSNQLIVFLFLQLLYVHNNINIIKQIHQVSARCSVHAPNLATMTCQLSPSSSLTTSTPALSFLLPSHRCSTRLNTFLQRKSPFSGRSHHTNWSSFHIPSHSQRLPPTRSNPFDYFLDNVRKVAGSSLQPDFNEDSSVDAEGLEAEDNEHTFVQLDPNSTGSVDGSAETTFGPLAMLAVGFLAEEFAALQQLLDDIGADEVNLIPCTQKLIEENRTLGEALSLDPQPLHETTSSFSSSSGSSTNTAINTRNQKVVFLSGMYASEVIEVVGAIRECDGVPDCAFAAAVPNSWGRKLKELVEDVFADHAAMAERRAQQMAQMEADRLAMEQGED